MAAAQQTDAQARGQIFAIQRFCVHDGPGIRTTVFFKGCPLRCPWCQNPESYRRPTELAWYQRRCENSGACVLACPRDAITEAADRIDRNLCDLCGDCVTACAHGAFELVGREVLVDEIVEAVVRDLPFYHATGGGVTLSGGEPTFQMELATAVARACAARNIGVGLQTCGQFRWPTFEPLLSLLEFVQLDLKILIPQRHREILGGDVAQTIENARALVRTDVPVELRMPIVPGYTDDEENLAALVDLLGELGIDRVSLMRYHPMGETKRRAIGSQVPSAVAANASAASHVNAAATWLRNRGVEIAT